MLLKSPIPKDPQLLGPLAKSPKLIERNQEKRRKPHCSLYSRRIKMLPVVPVSKPHYGTPYRRVRAQYPRHNVGMHRERLEPRNQTVKIQATGATAAHQEFRGL